MTHQSEHLLTEVTDDPVRGVGPASCCAEPSIAAALERVERRARADVSRAAGRPGMLAHARTVEAERRLELSEELAERRYEQLACGLRCLDADIETARIASHSPRRIVGSPVRVGCVPEHRTSRGRNP